MAKDRPDHDDTGPARGQFFWSCLSASAAIALLNRRTAAEGVSAESR